MIWLLLVLDVLAVGALIYAFMAHREAQRALGDAGAALARLRRTRFSIVTPAGPLIDVGLEYLSLQAAMAIGEPHTILRVAGEGAMDSQDPMMDLVTVRRETPLEIFVWAR